MRFVGLSLLVTLSGLVGTTACNKAQEFPTEPPAEREDSVAVEVRGQVFRHTGEVASGVFAHVAYGLEAAPRRISVRRTNFNGLFAASGDVPSSQCQSLRIIVTSTSRFGTNDNFLGDHRIGTCQIEGTVTVNLPKPGPGIGGE